MNGPRVLLFCADLKRFSEDRYRSKITSFVEYPVDDLDLSSYASPSAKSSKNNCIYDLYSVSEHRGTVYGGHYTAFAKHPYLEKWFHYSDTRVTSTSKKNVQTSDAYILFYELRNCNH